MDVIFVLDHTESIDTTESDYFKIFLNEFAEKVSLGGDNYRIGVLSWNANVNVSIRLLDHISPGDVAGFQSSVSGIARSTSESDDIGQAIMTMREHFREGFGARSYALHVGILMADGGVTFGDEITLARDEDIILFGIALVTPGSVPPLLQTFIDTLANGIADRAITSIPDNLLSDGVSDTIIDEIQTCSELFITHQN